ncbi:uncharacterized protein TNCV_745871 [Trichonephila clavipes]|nr:uncharacterized protein TNCV_745871 [Trichonephila clavipes]
MNTPSIILCHHYSPVICPLHPATTCIANHATALRSHFSTSQSSVSNGKGVTRWFPLCYYPSWACTISRFVSIEHIWDHLKGRNGHSMNLNETEARLQQIWNDTSQDMMKNLYASMSDRITSCIRTRGCSTGY